VRAASADIGARAWRVLIAIAACADRTGTAYPSLARITSLTRIRHDKILAAIRKLEDAGLVQRERSKGGRTRASVYRILFDEPETGPDLGPVSEPKQDPIWDKNRTRFGAKTGPDLGPITYRTESRTQVDGALVPNAPSESFLQFWGAYPSRGGCANPKKPAQEKFEAAVKRGIDPELIIRSAELYAAQVAASGTETRFIAQAKTWLDEERWADDYSRGGPPPERYGMMF
jgi:hypothetical protein